ncbi:ROK family transcriptional regulator [Phytohabitans sp. LJ34]|uniref:ROK family transcriptional regulator n=1 Tax=Phytohabitans sp. LJ34 TaxID=3452217 RepID=UPI003F8C4F75
MRTGPSQEEVRRQNLGALLRYVHIHGPTSRAELTSELGLNRSTIGALTADLAGVGLVTEAAPRETGRAGRPSLVVRPESERVYAYAFSIEVDQLRVARVGLGGEVLDHRADDRPSGQPAAEAVPLLAEFVKDLQQAVPDGAVYVGGGVSVSRVMRRADGKAGLSGGADNAAVAEPLSAVLAAELDADRPLVVGNAADVAALAEHARGAAVGCDNVIYLHRDAGVDAGIIVGGRRLTGHAGQGGQVGHMVVLPGGRPCSCGSRGCWETEIGDRALLNAAGRDSEGGRGAALAVVDAASRGDASAQAAVRQVGDWLGFGLANLVNIFDPEMVIFGGTLRDVYLVAAAQVRSRLNSMALIAAREHVRLRTPQLGEDAALIGAAELAFERLLADPLSS